MGVAALIPLIWAERCGQRLTYYMSAFCGTRRLAEPLHTGDQNSLQICRENPQIFAVAAHWKSNYYYRIQINIVNTIIHISSNKTFQSIFHLFSMQSSSLYNFYFFPAK